MTLQMTSNCNTIWINHLTNQVWEHIYVDCPQHNHYIFGEWRWKVYDHRAQDQMFLLDAMNAACEDITADHCRGWCGIQRFFPGAWQWKTSDVMLMKVFGLTNKSDRMSTKNHFFHGRYFLFLCICGNIRNMKCTVIGKARFNLL